jgi:hypothetical protein
MAQGMDSYDVEVSGIRAGELDVGYMRRWVSALGLDDQWDAACRVAGIVV